MLQHSIDRQATDSVASAAALAGMENSRRPILQAAEQLLLVKGYSSVTMTHVAQQAKVSRATLYRYYSTKEQLYSDLTNEWAVNFINQLHQSTPPGATVGDRVSWVIAKIMDAVVENPALVSAHIATLVSDYETVQSNHKPLKELMPRIIGICAGAHQAENMAKVELNTLHLLISNSLLLNAGKTTKEAVVKSMIGITSLLLSDIWGKS